MYIIEKRWRHDGCEGCNHTWVEAAFATYGTKEAAEKAMEGLQALLPKREFRIIKLEDGNV